MVERVWPTAGGEVGAILRSWTGTESALGKPEGWPPLLRTTAQVLLASPAPMTLFWGPDCIQVYNDAYAVIAGARHPAILGQALDDNWPELLDFHAQVKAHLAGGEPLSYRDLPVVLLRNGAAENVWLTIDYGPIFDEAGGVAGVLAIVTETTERVQAQRERDEVEAELRRREQELAQVQRIGRVGGLEVDLREGFRNFRSPEYLAVHGLPPESRNEAHEDWVRRIHPEDRARIEAHFLESVAGNDEEYQAEYRIIRPSDGATRWISALARIERDEHGKAIRLIGAHRDVTERKEAEAEQRLLMQELAHRVKNSMAMIRAIASQTLRNAPSLAAADEAFGARLTALSQAHDLLVSGTAASAAIADVVASIAAIHGSPDRLRASGPPIALGSKASLALTLVLHELSTNAVKYGALSNETGHVALSWRVEERDDAQWLRLCWQESGGPPVAPPSRRGFGSRLIERSLSVPGSQTTSDFAPEGLVFTLEAPLEALGAAASDEAS